MNFRLWLENMQGFDEFLDSIMSQFHDPSVKQVAADWLEERGNPLGNILRLISSYHQAKTKEQNKIIRQIGEEISKEADALEDKGVIFREGDYGFRYEKKAYLYHAGRFYAWNEHPTIYAHPRNLTN